MLGFYHNSSRGHTTKVDIHSKFSLLRKTLWSLCTDEIPKLAWKNDLEFFTEMLIQGGKEDCCGVRKDKEETSWTFRTGEGN